MWRRRRWWLRCYAAGWWRHPAGNDSTTGNDSATGNDSTTGNDSATSNDSASGNYTPGSNDSTIDDSTSGTTGRRHVPRAFQLRIHQGEVH